MMLKKWDELPAQMQTDEVKKYYEILENKQVSLLCKRMFDIAVSLIMLIVFSPIFVVLGVVIKLDSPGPVFYRQERVTQYGKKFKIFKFRTMVSNADQFGTHVTVKGDNRITRVGRIIRKCRLDELSQLIDVLRGTMTFVGTRPEAVKYVEHYTQEMMATLLLPAGITSEASIMYKNEAELLSGATDADRTYIKKILPDKMRYNLYSLEHFSFLGDIAIMFKTFWAVVGKEYPDVLERKGR